MSAIPRTSSASVRVALYEATQEINKGDLAKALTILDSIPAHHSSSLYEKVALATTNNKKAIEVANKIFDSAIKERVLASLEHPEVEVVLTIESLIDSGDFAEAKNQLSQLPSSIKNDSLLRILALRSNDIQVAEYITDANLKQQTLLELQEGSVVSQCALI